MKKIDKYATGWVFTHEYKNITIIKQFYTPCFISLKGRLFELHNDFIIEHKNENYSYINNEEMKAFLPRLLELGKMLERPE